jgi:hypothetical protein
MAHSVFKCPATGFNVQHQLDDDPDVSEDEYEAITCPACLHLLNRKMFRFYIANIQTAKIVPSTARPLIVQPIT